MRKKKIQDCGHNRPIIDIPGIAETLPLLLTGEYEAGVSVSLSLCLSLSLSLHPKLSIPPVKLSFRGGRFKFGCCCIKCVEFRLCTGAPPLCGSASAFFSDFSFGSLRSLGNGGRGASSLGLGNVLRDGDEIVAFAVDGRFIERL